MRGGQALRGPGGPVSLVPFLSSCCHLERKGKRVASWWGGVSHLKSQAPCAPSRTERQRLLRISSCALLLLRDFSWRKGFPVTANLGDLMLGLLEAGRDRSVVSFQCSKGVKYKIMLRFSQTYEIDTIILEKSENTSNTQKWSSNMNNS